jgi:signal transduction histidine kinase
MKPRSLRARLLLGAAGAIALALALAWAAMGFLFEAHLERSVEANLMQHGRDLIAGLGINAAGDLSVDPEPYDPRFDQPASGLYWQAGAGTRALRSRSLWDEALASADAPASAWKSGEMAGPFGQTLVFVAREIRLADGGAPLVVTLGADHAAVTAARGEFARELALFLGVLWLVLAGAAWVQVHLGLRPLEAVRVALRDMQGQPNARLAEADYPAEAAPLAQAINALAEAREQDLARARQRAADLAHSLKTPLAALAAQSRRAREAGAGDRAIEAARGAVERELARTRLAAEPDARVAAAAVIDRLIAVVERTEHGARLGYENELGQATLPLSAASLMEIAGPLLENAAHHARTRVRISGDAGRLCVEDDGAGLTVAEAALVLARGKRLDESGDGHGLGLAIVREIAELTGGELTLARSDLGGLLAQVCW